MNDDANKPPSALPPLASAEPEREPPASATGATGDDVDEGNGSSPTEEVAVAFDHLKRAAGKLVAKADPALKGATGAVDQAFKGVSGNVDAVIDKMDPAIENATKEAMRIAGKVAKSAEPMTKQVQAGIGRFADRLGKWARGGEEE